MPFLIEARHVFPDAVVGTPPFEFGLLFRGDGDTANPTDVLALQTTLTDAWSDNLTDIVWSGIHAGELQLTITDDNGVTEIGSPLDNGTGSPQSYAPQVAIRARLIAPRPPKGRANACYIPLPDGDSVNQEGAVAAPAQVAVVNWGDAIAGDDPWGDISWVARHQIGGADAPVTYAHVTAVSCAPTSSYLRRRYR